MGVGVQAICTVTELELTGWLAAAQSTDAIGMKLDRKNYLRE